MNADVPVVETSALEAVFPGGDGVGPFDLVIRRGERVLVLGPSGSGKSTLLRLLHGAVPDAIPADVSGQVRVAGRAVASAGVAGLADVVGVVAQDPESGVCLSEVEEEVAFPLENIAVDPAAITARVEVALQRAGAAGLGGRGTAELSGGELQRVAVAAAIATDPQLLLLDEPTAMLDADGITAVRKAIDSSCRATGAACVLVEHRLDEFAGDDGIAGLPERWIVLGRDGRVRHDVPARELSAGAVRDLIALGCWLPLELELPALLAAAGTRSGHGGPAGRVLEDPGIGDALRLLIGDSTPVPSGPVRDGPPLQARGVTASRGTGRRRRPVLTDVHVQLRPGEIAALVGANGSGKSTLLACLAGLNVPTEGRVQGPRAGLVFQNPEHQFMAATVRAEVTHGLPPTAAADAEAMLRRFRLEGFAGHNPYRLSGGQKRRLSLAAMLLHDRPYLLADEPGLGLDRPAVIDAMRALRDAAREGRGVLFSSHDLRAVAGYADRVLVLGDGRLLADTTPLRLLRDPALLGRARLRPPKVLRRLADEVDDDAAMRGVLHHLDHLTVRLGTDRQTGVPA